MALELSEEIVAASLQQEREQDKEHTRVIRAGEYTTSHQNHVIRVFLSPGEWLALSRLNEMHRIGGVNHTLRCLLYKAGLTKEGIENG